MGLTGTILDATFRLKPIETGWMRQRTFVAQDLDGADGGAAGQRRCHLLGRVDRLALRPGASLGRSLIFTAEHATRAVSCRPWRPRRRRFRTPKSARLSVPIDLPAGP
jgi:hypothetical protein